MCFGLITCVNTALPFSSVRNDELIYFLIHDKLVFSLINNNIDTWTYNPNILHGDDCYTDVAQKVNCNYYDVNEFNEKFSDMNISNCLSCCHLNFCSFTGNINAIQSLLNTISMKFDVITFTETWLT